MIDDFSNIWSVNINFTCELLAFSSLFFSPTLKLGDQCKAGARGDLPVARERLAPCAHGALPARARARPRVRPDAHRSRLRRGQLHRSCRPAFVTRRAVRCHRREL